MTPWSGAWAADVDVDLEALPELPTGPAVLTIGSSALVGTIDAAQSGRFGPRARARVVAGAGGWEKTVGPKHYHNDGGVLTTAVLSTTAAEVGERVVETTPGRFGIDFVRPAGPAARVLSGLSWFVNATGTTIVGPRLPTPATPTMEVLTWDPRGRVATIGTDEIVTPGMVLTDTRFGTAKVRDVEQTWGDHGARATAWTVATDKAPSDANGGPELVALVGAIAREAAQSTFLQTARYRVISQAPDGRFLLQPVKKQKGLPDLKAISLAPAVPGMSVKVPPGTVLHIVFVDGDRNSPVVVRFENGPTPIEVTFDNLHTHVGSGLAPTVGPVAMASGVLAAIAAIAVYAEALKGLVPATLPAADTLKAALATAALAAPIPSTRLFSE